MAEQQEKLVEVQNLITYFPIFSGVFQRKTGEVKAVDDISFFIRKGETLGLVGESGCGKTTTGRSILKLEEPTSGNVFFEGKNLIEMKGEPLRKMRAHMQPIFQDPFASLNPRMTVGDIIGEPLMVHDLAKGKEITERVEDLLNMVGLAPQMAERYPHEFQWRPKAAHWHCSGPGGPPFICRLRRSGLGAGCFHSRPDRQTSDQAARGVEADLPFHLA